MSGVPGQVEDGDQSINYPNFSPPPSYLVPSLPEPLISLPNLTSEQQNSCLHGQNSLVPHTDIPDSQTLSLRLKRLETLCNDLKKQKNVMEDEFGQQRKKFINLMIQNEAELNTLKKSVEHHSSEAQKLSQQLKLRDIQIQDMVAVSKAMESSTREAFDADRIKLEEEIASLHKIIAVERDKYQKEIEVLLHTRDMSSGQRSPSPGDPSLDIDMAKAVQESKLLKDVVQPYETEIKSLQQQLSEANEKMKHSEEMVPRQDTPPLIDLDTSDGTISGPLTNTQLKLERTARHDLEMHTRSLEQQKILLQSESDLMKKTVKELNDKLKDQEEKYKHLQQTWEMANQHFIVSQDKLRQKIYFMEQKQQLLFHDSNHSSELFIPAQSRPVNGSRHCRSHSCGDIIIRKDNNNIQILALESELKRVRHKLQQQTAQLQRVQEQMCGELDEKDQELNQLRQENSKARAGVGRERKTTEELRRKMEEACQTFKAQVESYQSSMQIQQSKLKALNEQYTQSKHEAQRDVARFSDERVTLFAQITSAQEEYDCLKVVQAEEIQKYTQQINELRKAQAMSEENLAALQNRLTEIEEEKSRSEEDLGAQLAQLNEQYQLEQRIREKNEFGLNKQLEAARNQIYALEMVKAELGQEQQMKHKAVAACSDLEEKSRSFIAEQHHKLEMEVASRHAAEQHVRELQMQISSLRSQLNTSQENQKDFVELSQALQVKLAKIEEERAKSSSNPP